MGNFDSQEQIGYGKGGSIKTGLSNSKGPYYGSTSSTSGVKLFLENTWGSLADIVDDTRVSKTDKKIYAGQNSSPSIVQDTSTKDVVWEFSVGYTGSKSYTPYSTDVGSWGFPIGTSRTEDVAPDRIAITTEDTTTTAMCMVVGGHQSNTQIGITCLTATQAKIVDGVETYVNSFVSRLAFLFDDYSTLTIEYKFPKE